MKVGILGAGNVALATAAFLALEHHQVVLWSAFERERDALRDGVITAEGALSGLARITVCGDAGEVIAGAELVVIAAPAFGHEPLMAAAAPHLTSEHNVLVHPVTGLSSLILSRMMAAKGAAPTIIDASTSLFTARKTGSASVRILKVKDVIDVAAIPADRGAAAMRMLQQIFGERFRLEPNALAVSLNNHNPVYHVGPLLCNLSRADRAEEWIFWEGITPSVARLVELVDVERLAIVRHFGTTEIPVADYFRQAHGAVGENLAEIFESLAKKLRGPIGPQMFEHRFITEDVPYALVFYHSLGAALGIPMPVTRNLIELTSALYARDFTAQGHTLERLGLAGLTDREILERTITGFRPSGPAEARARG
jgi:opine dehydrogenase